MSQVQCSRKIKQPYVLVIFILSVLVLVLIITWFFFCIAILKPLLSLIFSLSFYCFLQTLKFKVSSLLSSATAPRPRRDHCPSTSGPPSTRKGTCTPQGCSCQHGVKAISLVGSRRRVAAATGAWGWENLHLLKKIDGGADGGHGQGQGGNALHPMQL